MVIRFLQASASLLFLPLFVYSVVVYIDVNVHIYEILSRRPDLIIKDPKIFFEMVINYAYASMRYYFIFLNS